MKKIDVTGMTGIMTEKRGGSGDSSLHFLFMNTVMKSIKGARCFTYTNVPNVPFSYVVIRIILTLNRIPLYSVFMYER